MDNSNTKHDIHLSQGAKMVIENLRHPCGTYEYYDNTLKRLFNHVLVQSDEIGMDDAEAIQTLRTLQALREDMAILANHHAIPFGLPGEPEDEPDPEDPEDSGFNPEPDDAE